MARILERIWHGLQRTVVLLGILALLLLLLILTFALPQSPVSPADEAAFLRWLAQVRTSLGINVSLLASLGLLSLRFSWWARGVLALLALVAVARAARCVEQWEHLTLPGRIVQVAILVGALLLLTGWGAQLRSGWIETGISAWPDEALTLPSRDISLPAPEEPAWIRSARYGLYLIREGTGLGLEITADEDGVPISLLTSLQGEPMEHLRIILTPRAPDAYFALPSGRLIFRLTLQRPPPDAETRVQIYRGAGGDLQRETELQSGDTLSIDDVQVHLEGTPLPQLRMVYNPGAPLAAVGSGVLLLGTLAALSGHAGWLTLQREDDEAINISEEATA